MDLSGADMVIKPVVGHRHFPCIPVSLDLSFETGEEILASYLFNLSESGPFINTTYPPEEGTRTLLFFRFPNYDEPLDIVGTVVRRQGREDTSKPGIGVHFDEVLINDRKRLDAYIMDSKK
jgi:uncharacterized protein (TIGR02266 family)